jgi:hypothetical protein
MKGENMEIGIALLVGLVVGVGSTVIGTKLHKEEPIVIEDKTSQVQQEVIKQLTDLDIVEKLCSPSNVETTENRLLCRELSCLVYSRGIDSKTGESCEEIQNLANTVSLFDYCSKQEDTEKCFETFWKRK